MVEIILGSAGTAEVGYAAVNIDDTYDKSQQYIEFLQLQYSSI